MSKVTDLGSMPVSNEANKNRQIEDKETISLHNLIAFVLAIESVSMPLDMVPPGAEARTDSGQLKSLPNQNGINSSNL